jgi:hypothetical protein
MTTSNTPITILNGETRTIQVPHGEAAYWGRLIASRANVTTMVLGETPYLPYLGHIRCPEDWLAAEWLIDQHHIQPVQETK